ncbi:MAG: hypothetical protein LBL15_02920 [Oscillospiraceae bacterium]|jgi:hypothetical protein|nr:hypothetical protein [Oscillospiraceae bacterium]
MKPDRRDTELLRLAGKYRWLPYAGLGAYGLDALAETAAILFKTGYIGISRNKRYLKPAPKGYAYLEQAGYFYDTAARRAYAGSTTLRRRLEVSAIMLTCLRAGIDVLRDEVDALREQPVFFPAFDLRAGGVNVMSNANCAGFGHFGNTAYMLHYVSPQSAGMYLMNELSIFHRLSSVFAQSLSTPAALIFAGPGYGEIYARLHEAAPSTRHGVRGFTDFPEIFRRADLPVHLLSCDETGAMQLALMRQPDYKAKLARAAYWSGWVPHDEQIPCADGRVGDAPLVVAADMDIRRIGKVCDAARRLGKSKVMIAAFQSQLEDFLMKVFPSDGMVTHFCIDRPILDAAFQGGFSLYAGEAPDMPGAGDGRA